MLTLEEIQAALDAICPKHSVEKTTLFGSYAHGTATKDSDVDVLVEFRPNEGSASAIIAMQDELEQLLGKKVDIVEMPTDEKSFLILDEKGIPMFLEQDERDKRLLRSFISEVAFLRTQLSNQSFSSFMDNEVLKKAVAMTIIEMDELLKALSNGCKKQYTAIPFTKITKARNAAAHAYKRLTFQRVWDFIQTEILPLETLLQ